MKKKILCTYFAVCSALLFSNAVSAYIDPSAMTYIIQIVAGIAIAAGAAFSFYFRKLKRAFEKVFRQKNGVAVLDHDDFDDDDDTGLGDYDIPEEYLVGADDETRAIFCVDAADAADTADAADAETAVGAEDVPKITVTAVPITDKYDERGGESYLEAENRELRRLLAIERRRAASSGGK